MGKENGQEKYARLKAEYESEKRINGAETYYQLRAENILLLLDYSSQIREDHTLAYTCEILHCCLEEAFFEKDQKEGNPFELIYHFFGRRIWSDKLTPDEQIQLGAHYALKTEKVVKGSARNKNPGIRFSPKQEEGIQKVIEQARSNAKELVEVVISGEEVKPRLLVRLPVAISLLYSGVSQFLQTIPDPLRDINRGKVMLLDTSAVRRQRLCRRREV